MPPNDFFAFLAAGIKAMQSDVPLGYRRFHRQFSPMRARLGAGGETRTVWLDGDGLVIATGTEAATLEARFELRVIDDLVDGRMTLLDAVLADELWLRGRPEHLERFFDAFGTFVIAGMRSQTMQCLMRHFRARSSSPRLI